MKDHLAIVTTARNEKPFMNEWLLYHRMIGADHFFLYDDEPGLPLESFCAPHQSYVTVMPLHGWSKGLSGGCRQNRAYTHALDHFLGKYMWAAFIDVDEFIVLRQHENLGDFLLSLGKDTHAVSLHWRMFGHCGFYEDPRGLVTASLVRRKKETDTRVKTISRCGSIAGFVSQHVAELKEGKRIEVSDEIAHINHYQCRSFKRHMARVDRGDCVFTGEGNDPTTIHRGLRWKLDKEACLRHFVEKVALDHNELIDDHMLKYKPALEAAIGRMRRPSAIP